MGSAVPPDRDPARLVAVALGFKDAYSYDETGYCMRPFACFSNGQMHSSILVMLSLDFNIKDGFMVISFSSSTLQLLDLLILEFPSCSLL